MDNTLKSAIDQADIDNVLLMAIEHADTVMRKYIWRGFKPKASKLKNELMVGDKAAKDFVNEALKRLCSGQRSYNNQRSLLENLNSITDSIISSEKKTSDRTGVVDFGPPSDEAADNINPLEVVSGNVPAPDKSLVDNEIRINQEKCFAMIRLSFDGDKQTQDYLDALSQDYHDIKDISELTEIPVEKIYEIRRKLKKHTALLFGVKNYAGLERKIVNPSNESESKSTG